jgi:capsular exopolysaccharide synthesis family protein
MRRPAFIDVLRRRPAGRSSHASEQELDEAYRIIAANLQIATQEIDRPVVVFTSARKGEGKTSTIAKLAPLMARSGQRVIVADVDLRHPGLHQAFGLPNERGFADVLRGDARLEDCLQHLAIPSETGTDKILYALTAGTPGSNSGELLAGPRAARVLDVLAEQADIVLVDAPPVLPVADSLMLARSASGVVLVVEARRTPIPVVCQAKDALIRNQARILGVVISKVQPGDMDGVDYTTRPAYG